MLLTISTTHRPATDLGYLLFKHPDRVQEFAGPFGTATVFFPEATEERCTAALLLEVDPVGLARTVGRGSPDFALAQYVNDRSYATSSLMAVTLGTVFSTARSGRGDAHQALADGTLPLEIAFPALSCRGGSEVVRRVFEPLGWDVVAQEIPLDEQHPDWGASRYLSVTLTGDVRLADALNQLHVLLPVLDESKHYWQSEAEVGKLWRSGVGWLAGHPDAEFITKRYLKRSRALQDAALARLEELSETDCTEATEETDEPFNLPLSTIRHDAVMAALHELGAKSVIDLGCGPGAFLKRLAADHTFTRLAGVDVSIRSLQTAAQRLNLDSAPERERERITLFQGALTYSDERLRGYDAAVLMEVIEHVDLPRLDALERAVFGDARPGAVLVTTPNAEFNVNYEGVRQLRHNDHRFEFSRAEFQAWATRVAERYGYSVTFRDIGHGTPAQGCPTQMGVFQRAWS